MLLLVLFLFLSHPLWAKRPVIILHGLFDYYSTMDPLVDMIKKADPSTPVVSIDFFNGIESLFDLGLQVDEVIKQIEGLGGDFDGPQTCIGFSQGGVVLRGMVELWGDHRCEHAIFLSNPLVGQFGVTDVFAWFFGNVTREQVRDICYVDFVDRDVSVCQYWADPFHLAEFFRDNDFLTVLNGEKPAPKGVSIRDNFLKLKQVVCISGPQDDVITPYQSAHFGYYGINDTDIIVPMEQQEFYIGDQFGLKTLNEQGAVHLYTVDGVNHHYWYKNSSVFNSFIWPHLL